jgi:hypothetical protein
MLIFENITNIIRYPGPHIGNGEFAGDITCRHADMQANRRARKQTSKN